MDPGHKVHHFGLESLHLLILPFPPSPLPLLLDLFLKLAHPGPHLLNLLSLLLIQMDLPLEVLPQLLGHELVLDQPDVLPLYLGGQERDEVLGLGQVGLWGLGLGQGGVLSYWGVNLVEVFILLLFVPDCLLADLF